MLLLVVAREEAGTPNVIGDIRAALALMIKDRIGAGEIGARDTALTALALARWRSAPRLELRGDAAAPRLPIFSFRVRDGAGGYVHHQLVTRMLSDYWGVQARGGCACAGPYAHRLLEITERHSHQIWEALRAGREFEKPGWIRVKLSYLMTDETVERIIDAVSEVALCAEELADHYVCDPTSARFSHTAMLTGSS